MNSPEERPDTEREEHPLPPVAAIAASAGGLNATKRLLQHMPTDSGIALVVIHHLAPDHESLIPELLQSVTEMPVSELNEPVHPKPNHVYTIPPDRYLEIRDGYIIPVQPTQRRGHRMAVDHFLRTLAQACGPKAMCAILSGTGTDGSLGLKEINEAGGLVLAQSPEQAEFKGMPASAIATQMVDRVLDAERMPEFFTDFIRTGSLKETSPGTGTQEIQSSLDEILATVRKNSGHDFSRYKKATLLRRIHRRMALARITEPESYAELLANDPEESQYLFRDLLISVTRFFRDPQIFEYVAKEILPNLCHRLSDTDPLRIWVPGVATGEEAYTLAILVQEYFLESRKTCPVVIFATDIDGDALNSAREGRYPRSIENDVSQERLDRYFTAEGEHYRINRDIRKMVTFAEQNILTDPPYSRLDLISCRNLMIYLGQPVQQRTLALFHFGLKPDGVLLLGTSETIGRHLNHLFKPISGKWRIYRRIGSSRRLEGSMPSAPSERMTPAIRPVSRRKAEKKEVPSVEEKTREAVLSHITTCAAVVNRNMEVVYIHGKSGPYLTVPSGRMQNMLPLMAQNGLQIRVRQVLQKVIHGEEPEASATGRITTDETDYRVTITAHPLQDPSSGLYVCFFDRREMLPPPAPEDISSEEEANRRISELEHTVKENREELSSTIEELEMSNEELRASNEEIISINEELQSSSEELETSKEELQSLNEELTTLNQQLQDKVEELTRAHDDMANLLAGTEIAAVFLDLDLRIRQTTPAADELINTRPADQGRPLSHFASPFIDVDLLHEAEQVLADQAPAQRQVRKKAGRWFELRVLPYRTGEGDIDGAVLTFVDIDRLIRIQSELEDREQRLRLALEGADMGSWEFDPASEKLLWDQRMFELFGIEKDAAPGNTEDFFELIHEEDRSEVRKALTQALEKTGIYDAEFRITCSGSRKRWLAGRGQVFYDDSGRPRQMLGVNYDITDRRRAEIQLQQLNDELEERVAARTAELHHSREQIRRITHMATTAEERERRRIAEGLHDDVQQLLSACTMTLERMRGMSDREKLEERVEKVLDWSSRALEATRHLIFDLSPAVLYEVGLAAALDHLASEMKKRFGLDVGMKNGVDQIDPLAEDLRIFLYSTIRELLFNVVKHSGVESARVFLNREDDRLTVEVTDSGRGFNPAELSKMRKNNGDKTGLGLMALGERLSFYGGDLDLVSAPGEGTNIRITAPVEMEEESEETA